MTPQQEPLGLISACESGNLQEVKLILDNGADIATTNEAAKALYCASTQGHLEVVKLLLERGATMDLPNDHPTPLSTAAGKGHLEVVRVLLDNGANIAAGRPLWSAVFNNQLEVLQLLLDRGASVNDGIVPPIEHASRQGVVGIVKLLLERGTSQQYTNNALNGACQGGHIEVVKLLLDYGANIDHENQHGETPLLSATQGYRAPFIFMDIVKLLLERGVNLDLNSNLKACENALLSMDEDQVGVTEMLIQRPQVVAIPRAAILAVGYNTKSGSAKILQTMLENGANVNYIYSTDQHNLTVTALHYAVMKKDVKHVWILMVHGADPSIQFMMHQKKSTWDLANGDTAILEALLHFWTPQTHKLHPHWVRDAVLCTMLVARRQGWPFDKMILCKILSHTAYGWYTPKLNS